MKLQQLVNSKPVMVELMSKKMPAATSFKVMRNAKLIDEEITRYEEVRTNLINEYANRNDDGSLEIQNGNYVISDENIQLIQNELTDLLKSEIDISIMKIRIDELMSVELSPADLSNIEFMLEV